MVLLLDRSINCESKSGCVPAPRGRSIGNHAEVLAEIRSATPPNASVCNFVATGAVTVYAVLKVLGKIVTPLQDLASVVQWSSYIVSKTRRL
eukprot:SAG31_NODE_697_length_12745_cov_67.888502_11_plen_92_part_00